MNIITVMETCKRENFSIFKNLSSLCFPLSSPLEGAISYASMCLSAGVASSHLEPSVPLLEDFV